MTSTSQICQSCELLFSYRGDARYSRKRKFYAYLNCVKHSRQFACPLIIYGERGDINNYISNFRWVIETLIRCSESITEDMDVVFRKIWRRIRSHDTKLLILTEIARKAKSSSLTLEPWTARLDYWSGAYYDRCPRRIKPHSIFGRLPSRRYLIDELATAAVKHIDYQDWSIYLSSLPHYANFWAGKVKQQKEKQDNE